MLRTIWFFIWLFAYMVSLVPARLRANRLQRQGRLDEKQALVEATAIRWARAALRHACVTLEVRGTENLPKAGQNVVFVANHQSFLDIPIVLAGLDRGFPLMAKYVMKRLPFIRGWMKTLGCVFVKPGNLSMQATALRKSRQLLRQGSSLVIFPEGRRSESREMLPFLPAAFSLASRTATPIVPIAIDGCHKNFDCNGWRIQKTHVVMTILPAIKTEGLDAAQRRALPQQAAGLIRRRLELNERLALRASGDETSHLSNPA